MRFLCFGLILWPLLALFPAHSEPARPAKAPPQARVVIVQNEQATIDFTPQPPVIRQMVAEGLSRVTGQAPTREAWLSLVSPKDKIGIKVHSAPGSSSGTRPAVVEAIIQGLLDAGVPPGHIVIWDKQLFELRLAGFVDLAGRLGVRVASSADAGYDEQQFYESPLLGRLVFGDHEFGRKGESIGRKSFVSKLVIREMTKIIHVTPLLNHNLTGVSGNLLGLTLPSVDNTLRFENDPAQLPTVIPELYALPILGDRVVLNVVDALICQYEGGERGLLHYSAVLNQLRFSTDPVALDVLSLQELARQRRFGKATFAEKFMELYRNASLLEIGISDPRYITVEK